jgi:hypothetical protein
MYTIALGSLRALRTLPHLRQGCRRSHRQLPKALLGKLEVSLASFTAIYHTIHNLHSRLNASHAVCFGQQHSLNDLQRGRTTSDEAILERHILFPVSAKTGKVTRRMESYSSKSSLEADAVQAEVLDVNKELQKMFHKGRTCPCR